MHMRLSKWLGTLVLAVTSSVLASAATAQTNSPAPFMTSPAPNVPVSPRTLGIDAPFDPSPDSLITVSEVFNRAFFNESGDFYHNRSIPRQAAYIIGPGLPGGAGFPELELERDAKLINTLYRDLLEQQVASDPVIRTPDLPNPFDTSIRGLPVSRRFVSPRQGFLSPVEGSEFNFGTPLQR